MTNDQLNLTEQQLDDLLSQPTDGVIASLRQCPGDVIVLGAAGKMGPSLAAMVHRACRQIGDQRNVLAVSRFSDPAQRQKFESAGVRTIQCDLLDPSIFASLPEASNVIFMAGMKFGSTGQEALTWAMNAYVPALVCEKYARSRIVAYSTGNIYGLTSLDIGGSVETDGPNPVGDYAMSCLGRERIFQHFSQSRKTPVALIRLNYACECRYGVLVDLARKIWNSQPIDLAMGYFNVIWQGDAVAMSIQALERAASPAVPLNVTGPEILRVREVCEKFANLMNRKVTFVGSESPLALLSNASRALELFGRPRVSADELMQWIATWVSRSGRSLGKPTHFEVRDGKF
jgi:hypothetical protein